MKFLIFLFLCIATCLESVLAARAHVASVMVNSTILHRCDAFFVTVSEKNVTEGCYLVTTASCMSGYDERYIIAVGDSIVAQEQMFIIDAVYIHPNYSKQPDMYNIAVVHIKGMAKDVSVFELVESAEHYGLFGYLYLWRVVNKVFVLTKNEFLYVSETFYERATNQHLHENELAVMTRLPIKSRFYDLGAPFTFENLKEDVGNLKKNRNYIMGFIGKRFVAGESRYFALNSIPFYYKWIASILKGKEVVESMV